MLAAALFLALSPIVDDGRERLAEGDARGAMIRAEQAVRADPSDAEARVLLAQALLALGEADRAEKMAGAALRDGAGDAGRLALAEALYTLGRFADAEAAAEAAAPSDARAALLGLARAELALGRGEPEAALGALRDAIAADGFERRAELAAARAQYARGDLVRAQRLLDGLTRADDASFPALLLQSRVALRSGDAARAARLTDAMLARDPGNVSAGAVAIEAALRLGDAEKARAVHASLAPLGEDPRPAYLGALILLSEGRTRQAGDAIAPIEGWLATIDGGAVMMARVRQELGRTGQAEKILRDRLRDAPSDVAAAAMLVDVLDGAGKAARADEVLEDATRANPDAPVLAALRAERLIAAGRADEGLGLLEAQDPARAALLSALFGGDAAARPSSHLAASYAALRRGDAGGARAAAERAVAEDRSPAALNLLAAALMREGDAAGARAALEEAIEAEPDFLAPIANLARLEGGEDALLAGLERAAAAGADGATVLGQLAAERFAAGRTADAIEAARAAAETDDPEARLLLARLLIADGQDAKPVLLALLGDAPDAPGTVMVAASLLEATDDAGAAAPALSGLARRTGDPRHHLAAAAASAAAGDDRAAALAARAARKAAPDDPRTAAALIERETKLLGLEAGLAVEAAPLSTPHARALALAASGDEAVARRVLLAAEELDGRALTDLLGFARGTPDEGAAVDALAAHTRDDPGDVTALVALGAALTEAGRDTLAEDALRRALAAAPNDPVLLNNLASLRAERDPAGALVLARRAHARAPGMAAIAETYADLLAANGDRAGAARALRRARLAAPGDAGLAARVTALSQD